MRGLLIEDGHLQGSNRESTAAALSLVNYIALVVFKRDFYPMAISNYDRLTKAA
jgi:hypothetical protein